MDTSKTTCGGCGFLSTCNKQFQVIEVTKPFREEGILPSDTAGLTSHMLICVKHKREFKFQAGRPLSAQIVQLLAEEYNCDAFTAYRMGFSPKEHVELSMNELLKAEIAARAERDREWRESQRKEDQEREEKRRSSDREWQAKQRREDRIWHAVQSIFTFAITGVLGWIAKMLLGL